MRATILGTILPLLLTVTAHAGELAPVAPVDAPRPAEVDGRVDPEPDELPDEAFLAVERPYTVEARKPRWHGLIGFGTDFPVDIGGRFAIETPFGLRAHLGLGGMPRGYQRPIHEAAIALGAYDASFADLISSTLRAAFVLNVGLGMRPAPRKGFVFDIGYRLVRFQARNSPSDVLALLPEVGTVPAAWRAAADSTVSLTSSLHQISARIGWEWILKGHFLIRADVGASATLKTTHKLAPLKDVDLPADAAAQIDVGRSWIDEQLRRYAHTPTVGFSVGYRF